MTQFDMLDIVYNALKNGSLPTAITGSITKLERPMNSQTEDVVIVPIVQIDDPIHEGEMAINIHVPKVQHVVNKQPQMIPDIVRMKELAAMLAFDLKYIGGDGNTQPFQLYKSGENIINDELSRDYYFSTRISYQYYNN